MSDFRNFKIRPVLHLVKIFDVFKLLNIHFTSNTYFLWDQILNNGGYFYITLGAQTFAGTNFRETKNSRNLAGKTFANINFRTYFA